MFRADVRVSAYRNSKSLNTAYILFKFKSMGDTMRVSYATIMKSYINEKSTPYSAGLKFLLYIYPIQLD